MSELQIVLERMISQYPEVLGMLFLDEDGFPIVSAGDIPLNVNDLGATLAYCYKFHAQIGSEMTISLESIVVDFNGMRLCQCGLPNGILTVLARPHVRLGMLRFITRKGKGLLETAMKRKGRTEQAVSGEPRLRLPSEKEIQSIIARLENEPRQSAGFNNLF